MLIDGLDLFGGSQFVARLGFQDVGASALALTKQMLVLPELLFVGFFLGPGDIDLILSEQSLGVVSQHTHQQLLTLAAKSLIGKQCLSHTFAVIGIRLVVDQRLLHHKGRAIAVVITVFMTVATVVQIGGLGVVTPLVVAIRQLGQQAGAANDAAFQPRVALFHGPEKGRIIAQCLFVHLKRSHRLCTGTQA